MNSEIYKFLLEEGFNDDEINYIDENNDVIWRTNKLNCEKVFELLRSNNYTFNTIHDLILNNPIIISLSVSELSEIINNK